MGTKLSLLIGYVIAFFAPITATMIAIGFLIFIDTATGIWASKKKGEKITSKKLKTTLTKLIAYNLLVITAHLVETHLVNIIPFVSVTNGAIATVEFYSVLENIAKLTGKRVIDIIKEKLNLSKNDEKETD